MNLALNLADQPMVAQLGWTLVHSLWQGLAIAIILRLLLAFPLRRSAQARYIASCLALAAMALLPIAAFSIMSRSKTSWLPVAQQTQKAPELLTNVRAPFPSASRAGALSGAGHAFRETAEPMITRSLRTNANSIVSPDKPARIFSVTRLRQWLSIAVPWIALSWCVGVVLMSLWNIGGWIAVQRLKIECTTPASAEVESQIARLARRLGIARAVRVLQCMAIDSPIVIGVFKPLILVPASVLTDLPPSQIEALFAHELAHVLRQDYLINLIQTLLETLLFFNPAAWWVSSRIRIEREHCCDDLALSITRDRAAYVKALAWVGGAATPMLTPAASGGELLPRLRRLVAQPDADARRGSRWLAGLLALGACLVTVLFFSARRVTAQNAPARAASPATTRPTQTAMRELVVDVIDSKTHQPVAGAEVRPYISDNEHPVATTDAKGQGTIRFSAGTTSMNLWVRKAGYASTVTVFGKQAPVPQQYTMPIERGMKVGGIVVDENGTPIASATVAIWARLAQENSRDGRPHPEVYDVSVKTDANGKWSSDVIPPESKSVALRLSDPDFVSDDLYGKSSSPSLDELRSLSARSVMKKGIHVSGHVLDDNDQPVADAAVSLGGRAFGHHPPTTQSGPDGSFDLPHVAVGIHAPLIITAKNHAPWMDTLSVDGPRTDIKAIVAKPQPMLLRVVDQQGKPLANSRVFLQRWNGVDALWWDAHTDADGRLTWVEAPPNGATYDISHAGQIQVVYQPLNGGPQLQTVVLKPEITVKGSVVDQDTGRPIDHFKVIAGWTSRNSPINWNDNTRDPAIKGTDGKFQFVENLDRDGFAVRIDADGYESAQSQVFHVGEANVSLDFHLKRVGDLEGTLFTSDGKPLAGASVVMVTPGSQINIQGGKVGNGTFAPIELSDGSGHFKMTRRAGKFLLMVVSDEGFALLKPDELAKGGRIAVPPWGKIEGKAFIGSAPAAGHVIQVSGGIAEANQPKFLDPDFNRVRMEDEATADANGQFVLARVVPGRRTVGIQVAQAQAANGMTMIGWTQRATVEVEAGTTANVVLGGKGRPVIGRVIVPPELADQVDWYSGSFEIITHLHLPARALPQDWKTMTQQQRAAWSEQDRKRPDVIEYEKEIANRRFYPVLVHPDGTFRVDDVAAGQYDLQIHPQSPPRKDGRASAKRVSASLEFTVPEMPGGRSDQPLDIGNVVLKAN